MVKNHIKESSKKNKIHFFYLKAPPVEIYIFMFFRIQTLNIFSTGL